jgi:oxaloacetate decarboxylase alpha subunit
VDVVPEEVVIYLMGLFGAPPAPVDQQVKDRVLSSPLGRRLAGTERAQPSLTELRDQYGGQHLSDEELLLRYMVPLEDLQAAGPPYPGYQFTDTTSFPQLVDHLLTLNRPRHISLNLPQGSITLSR